MASSLDSIETFDEDGVLRVVIEASAGTRNKFKYDPKVRALTLHVALPAGTSFPLDFGFMPSTLGDDGDPLDALVFTDEPTTPGAVVPARLIGVIEATQARRGEKPKRNDRFVAVATHSHAHGSWRGFADVPAAILAQIESFFISYNAQRGIEFKPVARHGAKQAAQLLDKGRKRFDRR
jgi:inorganic pyrophosphatase